MAAPASTLMAPLWAAEDIGKRILRLQDETCTTLGVGNIGLDAAGVFVDRVFEVFLETEVKLIQLHVDAEGAFNGYAHVEFHESDDRRKAQQALSGTELGGHALTLSACIFSHEGGGCCKATTAAAAAAVVDDSPHAHPPAPKRARVAAPPEEEAA